MPELTPALLATLEKMVARGFVPASFPLYSNAIGIRRGSFAALLEPVAGGGIRIFGVPFYVVDGNPGVRVERDARSWFVWKSKSVEATPELLGDLQRFSDELADLLRPVA